MADDKPLSDEAADDRLKAASAALGEARGESMAADTALSAARKMLSLLSLGLLSAAENRARISDPPDPSVPPSQN